MPSPLYAKVTTASAVVVTFVFFFVRRSNGLWIEIEKEMLRMQQETLHSKHGYEIPCRNCWNGEDQVLIVCHGFGSSKESPMVQALNEEMPKAGIGVYSFDFPSHGESPVWEAGLRVPFCIDDLAVVEERVHSMAPNAGIVYFASSFGAYIALLYLSRQIGRGKRAVLRSAAVSMPKLVQSWLNEDTERKLDKQGYFVPDYDYVREMRITRDFLQDLEEYDVFARYKTGTVELCMVHGAKDSVAPPQDARAFAQAFQAGLVEFPQGEHSLMGEGELEEVLRIATEFFKKRKDGTCDD